MMKFEIWRQPGTATTCYGRSRLELRYQNDREHVVKLALIGKAVNQIRGATLHQIYVLLFVMAEPVMVTG